MVYGETTSGPGGSGDEKPAEESGSGIKRRVLIGVNHYRRHPGHLAIEVGSSSVEPESAIQDEPTEDEVVDEDKEK